MVSKILKSKPKLLHKEKKSSIKIENNKKNKIESKMNNPKKLYNNSIPLKTIINLWLLISLISIANAQTSTVLLKFNKTGSVKILGSDFTPERSDFTPEPNKVFVNGTQLEEYTNTISVENFTEVKLEWDSTNFL